MSSKKHEKDCVSLRKRKHIHVVNLSLPSSVFVLPAHWNSDCGIRWSLPSWLLDENFTLYGTTFFLIQCIMRKEYQI